MAETKRSAVLIPGGKVLIETVERREVFAEVAGGREVTVVSRGAKLEER